MEPNTNKTLWYFTRGKNIKNITEINKSENKYIEYKYRRFVELIQQEKGEMKDVNEPLILPTGKAPNHYIRKLTSSNIRKERAKIEAISHTKLGLNVDQFQARTFWTKVKKIQSIQLQSHLLSIIHDDIFTRNRLFRFNLITDPLCEDCHEIENSNHKLFECNKVKKVWDKITKLICTNEGILGYITKTECTRRELQLIARTLMMINYRVKIVNSEIFINSILSYLEAVTKRKGDSRFYSQLRGN